MTDLTRTLSRLREEPEWTTKPALPDQDFVKQGDVIICMSKTAQTIADAHNTTRYKLLALCDALERQDALLTKIKRNTYYDIEPAPAEYDRERKAISDKLEQAIKL
jgi:hypothetical protein